MAWGSLPSTSDDKASAKCVETEEEYEEKEQILKKKRKSFGAWSQIDPFK